MPYAADVLITFSELRTEINAEPQPRHEEMSDRFGILKLLQTKNQKFANMVNVSIAYIYNPETQSQNRKTKLNAILVL